MLPIQTSNVFSITKWSVECVNYLAIDDFNIANIGLTDCTFVGWLATFIRMENDSIKNDFAVGERFDFDLSFKNVRIRPIHSFHDFTISHLNPMSPAR